MNWLRALLATALLAAVTAHALVIDGIEVPDLPPQWTLDGKPLTLNGAGFREYGLFNIRVYAAALYTATPERDAAKLISATTPRVLHMKMLRDVARDDSVKAWQHYLAANCISPCTIDPEAQAAFRALIPVTAAGDTQTFVFRHDGLQLYRNGVLLGEVKSGAFANLVLSTWIGKVPTTEKLRSLLLGI